LLGKRKVSGKKEKVVRKMFVVTETVYARIVLAFKERGKCGI